MPYTKRQIYAITNKINKFLEKEPNNICFKKLKHSVEGIYESDSYHHYQIFIDPRRDIIPTLIHELLHHWHPDWCEAKVRREERKIVSALTVTQMKNMIKKLAKAI